MDHIRRLGVTTVELLPVHAFIDDSYLLEQGADATTGATTPIGFFAPGSRYAACRLSIRRVQGNGSPLHDAGTRR